MTTKWIKGVDTLTLQQDVSTSLSESGDTVNSIIIGEWSGRSDSLPINATFHVYDFCELWQQDSTGRLHQTYDQHFTVDGQPDVFHVDKVVTYAGPEVLPWDELLWVRNYTVQYDQVTETEHAECDVSLERAPGWIPTLSQWGLIIFGVVLLGFISWVFLKRRKAAVSLR